MRFGLSRYVNESKKMKVNKRINEYPYTNKHIKDVLILKTLKKITKFGWRCHRDFVIRTLGIFQKSILVKFKSLLRPKVFCLLSREEKRRYEYVLLKWNINKRIHVHVLIIDEQYF